MLTDLYSPVLPAQRAVILIVDDAPENLSVLGELLHTDYEVRAVTSGARALEIAALSPPPDLILLDVMMPEMDGYAVLARLRADPRTQEIPVIFVTAMDASQDEEFGLDLGAADYITKPLHPAVVLARVRTQLEAKHGRDWLRNQNSLLEAEVARRMQENQEIQDVAIHALARLAETRDPETGNHLYRTQGYVRVLAQQLAGHPRFFAGLSAQDIEMLIKSAPLHDIGKVGIPDHVLLKPGKFTADEWAVMQTHCVLGSRAIEQAEKDGKKPMAFLKFAKDVAHYHHERWDGAGYPERLAGENIPVAARLMAVADVFDALVTWRIYKDPMSYAEARQLIASERGRHFDPDVTDAFLACFDDCRAIAERFADAGAPSANPVQPAPSSALARS